MKRSKCWRLAILHQNKELRQGMPQTLLDIDSVAFELHYGGLFFVKSLPNLVAMAL
jgi:hypothetical protein